MTETPEPLSESSEELPRIGSDPRPRMFEPPPVQLLTVDDAHASAAAGCERELDDFYVSVLSFERDPSSLVPIYHAANFRLIFDIAEAPVEREDFRPIGVEVQSLAIVESRLFDRDISFEVQKSVTPGYRALLLRDPAGNWLLLCEATSIR